MIKIGDVFQHKKDGDIIEIIKFDSEGDAVVNTLEDPYNFWDEMSPDDSYSVSKIESEFKPLPGYGTKLWKVIHGD